MKITTLALGLFAAIITSGAAQASLINRGNGLIYDTDLNITWTNPAQLAQTWDVAQQWISQLNISNYMGFSNWRLPTGDSCLGYNCTGSEMGHLFFNELGGEGHADISLHHNANFSLFPSLYGQQYWTGTSYAPDTRLAYFFTFTVGASVEINKSAQGIHGWAVRDGDVVTAPVSAVPLPSAAWLLGSGLLGLICVVRRKAI